VGGPVGVPRTLCKHGVRHHVVMPDHPDDADLPNEVNQAGSGRSRWEHVLEVGGQAIVPMWLRPHRGEQRWSVLTVIAVAITLQLLLPDEFVLRPRTAAPVLEV
jgi:hypothetical protein